MSKDNCRKNAIIALICKQSSILQELNSPLFDKTIHHANGTLYIKIPSEGMLQESNIKKACKEDN